MTKSNREEETAADRLKQKTREDLDGEDPAEPPEPGRDSNTAKDTNVARGDDRSQSVRHSG